MATKDSGPASGSLNFHGDFSFINLDSYNMSNKHRQAVAWHVVHRYEPFKKELQAHVVGGESLPRRDRRNGQAHGLQPYAAQVQHLPSSHDCHRADENLLDPPGRDFQLDQQYSHAHQPAVGTSFGGPCSGPPESLLDTLLLFEETKLVPYLWPNGKTQHTQGFDSIAHLALLCAIAGIAHADRDLLIQSHLLQLDATNHLQMLLQNVSRSNAIKLSAVLDLCSFESITGDTRQARVYLKMLSGLVHERGGIIAVDPELREDILSFDCYFALKYGTRPLFTAKGWAIGKLHEPWISQLEKAGLLLSQPKRSPPPLLLEFPTLRYMLEALHELFATHSALAAGDLPRDPHLLQWCRYRKLYCLSRLADHFVNASLYVHQFVSPDVEAYCTIAAVLLTCMVLGCPEPVSFGSTLTDILRRLLGRDLREEHEKKHQHLRLWAVYVGSLAERLHYTACNEGSPCWFQTQLASISCTTGTREWPKLEVSLRQVLYSDALQREVDCGVPVRPFDLVAGLHTACDISWRLPAVADYVPFAHT